MSFLALPSEELEDELVQLGEASRVSFPSKQPQEASRGEEEKTRVDERGLFGLGVKDFWREKSRKKRVRRGLTEGKKLPEQLEKLIGDSNDNNNRNNFASVNYHSVFIKICSLLRLLQKYVYQRNCS